MQESFAQDNLVLQKELLTTQSREISKQLIEETEAYELLKEEKKDAEHDLNKSEQDLEREKKIARQREGEAKKLKIQQKKLKSREEEERELAEQTQRDLEKVEHEKALLETQYNEDLKGKKVLEIQKKDLEEKSQHLAIRFR